jgi:hypothetical protein
LEPRRKDNLKKKLLHQMIRSADVLQCQWVLTEVFLIKLRNLIYLLSKQASPQIQEGS